MFEIDSEHSPALLSVSSSSVCEPTHVWPKLPPSAIAVASVPVPCIPVAATSTNGAAGSLLAIADDRRRGHLGTLGVKTTVKCDALAGRHRQRRGRGGQH